jgi:hypothetical protein
MESGAASGWFDYCFYIVWCLGVGGFIANISIKYVREAEYRARTLLLILPIIILGYGSYFFLMIRGITTPAAETIWIDTLAKGLALFGLLFLLFRPWFAESMDNFCGVKHKIYYNATDDSEWSR